MKGIDTKPYTYFVSPHVTDNGEAVPALMKSSPK